MKKLFFKLAYEFRIPLAIAILWTSYELYTAQERSFGLLIKTFGPAFFLVSWAVGQFFRVKKQTEVEGSLEKIETRVENLLVRLDQHTKELLGNLNGGDSYVKFLVMFTKPDYCELGLINSSTYPVFDISCRLIDLDEPIDIENGRLWTDIPYQISHLSPQRLVSNCYNFNMAGKNKLNINVFILTRSQHITQEIRILLHPKGRFIGIRTSLDSGRFEVNGADTFPGYDPLDPDAIFRDHTLIKPDYS